MSDPDLIDRLPSWRFCDGRWREAVVCPPTDIATLGVASFNVWFAEHAFGQRADGLCTVLRETSADVIGLQEVTYPLLLHLLAQPWVREHYCISDAHGSTFADYGVILLSRLPIRRLWQLELPSCMGRKLLVCEFGESAVATVHLESLAHYQQDRIAQMQVIFTALQSAGNAVLMGDMNFDTGTAENRHIDPDYLDLWPALHPNQPGWTLDNTANTMRHALGKNPKPARFDRILLRGSWQARSIELLGTEPIAPTLHPSDHFGLHAQLTCTD